MKSKNLFLFLVFVCLLFQGCIPSLHPLYTKDKLVMKESVMGVWKTQVDSTADKNSKSIMYNSEWHFMPHNGESYTLIYYDSEGMPGVFEAHLLRLNEEYFFNFQPIESHEGIDRQKFNEFEALHYYPANTFAKVTFEGEGMSISMLNGSFVERLLENNRIRIKHEKVKDHYILTASSDELQKFVLKYSDTEDAFSDAEVLTKVP